jgi:hypothetical protein
VDVSCEDEIYPSVPRPRVVDVREAPPALLRRNAVVETSCEVEM